MWWTGWPPTSAPARRQLPLNHVLQAQTDPARDHSCMACRPTWHACIIIHCTFPGNAVLAWPWCLTEQGRGSPRAPDTVLKSHPLSRCKMFSQKSTWQTWRHVLNLAVLQRSRCGSLQPSVPMHSGCRCRGLPGGQETERVCCFGSAAHKTGFALLDLADLCAPNNKHCMGNRLLQLPALRANKSGALSPAHSAALTSHPSSSNGWGKKKR